MQKLMAVACPHYLFQGKYHGGKLEDGDYDNGHEGMKLEDFLSHKYSRSCGLSEGHVLAVRIYTTSSYPSLNVPMRKKKKAHPLKMTMYHLDEGLRKLRTVAATQRPEDFSKLHLYYRGMTGVAMNCETLIHGGIERAPMSTSNKREVAESYSGALKVFVRMHR